MNTVNSLITLILLLVAVFSVATSNPLLASTNEEEGAEPESNDPEEEAEESAENDETTVYDDNPDLDGDGVTTPEEEQKFTDAAVALGDKLNNPSEEPEIPNCDFDEFVNDDNECEKIPEDPVTAALPPCDGSLQNCVTPAGDVCLAGASTHECEESVTCPDGVTVVEELSECPDPDPVVVDQFLPFLNGDGDETLNQDEEEDYEPNPYCDLQDTYGDFRDYGPCHDRKDYYQGGPNDGLYPCNDGSDKVRWQDCEDATEKDENKDEDGESPQSTTAQLAITEPDPNRFSPIDGGVYFPTESIPNPDRLKFGPFGILLPNQAEEFRSSATASTSSIEESSCKILGSADGILQKFDIARYQACGLYTNGQIVYSDGFVAGCIQVGNTQLICQSLVDSSKLNVNMLATQTPTQAVTQPTQGIQPAAVNK